MALFLVFSTARTGRPLYARIMLRCNAPLGEVAVAAEGCRMPRSALDTAEALAACGAVAAASSPVAVLDRLLSRPPSRDRPELRERSCRRGRACRTDYDAVNNSRRTNR